MVTRILVRAGMAAVGLLLFALGINVEAGAQSTFGSIVGVVKEPGGLMVPGAQLTLSGLDTNLRARQRRIPTGHFSS